MENAEALLEQMRQMKRGAAGPLRGGVQETGRMDDFAALRRGNEMFAAKRMDTSENNESVDNLEKKVDQIEKAVNGANAGVEREAEESGEAVYQSRAEADNPPTPERRLHSDRGEEGETAEPEKVRTNSEKAKKTDVPLAARLEELDRAVSVLTAIVPEGRDMDRVWWTSGRRRSESVVSWSGDRSISAYPRVMETTGESWNMGHGLGGFIVAGGENLRWAEQADRAFRRDSRRYDGGFYLY